MSHIKLLHTQSYTLFLNKKNTNFLSTTLQNSKTTTLQNKSKKTIGVNFYFYQNPITHNFT